MDSVQIKQPRFGGVTGRLRRCVICDRRSHSAQRPCHRRPRCRQTTHTALRRTRRRCTEAERAEIALTKLSWPHACNFRRSKALRPMIHEGGDTTPTIRKTEEARVASRAVLSRRRKAGWFAKPVLIEAGLVADRGSGDRGKGRRTTLRRETMFNRRQLLFQLAALVVRPRAAISGADIGMPNLIDSPPPCPAAGITFARPSDLGFCFIQLSAEGGEMIGKLIEARQTAWRTALGVPLLDPRPAPARHRRRTASRAGPRHRARAPSLPSPPTSAARSGTRVKLRGHGCLSSPTLASDSGIASTKTCHCIR
jgi:hypothetical protein